MMPRSDHEETGALRTRLGLRDGERVVFTAGRLSHEQGHADLLRAFAELRKNYEAPLRLVIAGEGPERENLAALGRRLGLDQRVILAGYQHRLAPFYGIADVFTLPSHSEGSPNVLLEAMVAGVPIVATAVGGVPELAENGRNAILVPRGDAKAMADGMRRLLCDSALCQRLTDSAREVLSRNTPELYYQSISHVLTKVWEKKRGSKNVA
jgi:glycosyltransferase involved in cell wall biosynthesis